MKESVRAWERRMERERMMRLSGVSESESEYIWEIRKSVWRKIMALKIVIR